MQGVRPEAILYDILDRCSVRGGGAVDPEDPAVAALVRRGLIELRGFTLAQTTAKGHDTMRVALRARALESTSDA